MSLEPKTNSPKIKIKGKLSVPLTLTEAGSHSLNDFWGLSFKLNDQSYKICAGTIPVAIIKKYQNVWVTDQTDGQRYKSLQHAVDAIIRRLQNKVGRKPEAVEDLQTMQFLHFYPDPDPNNITYIAWKVTCNGHVANVTKDLVTESLKIYDPEYKSCLHTIPAIKGVVQWDKAEEWIEANLAWKPKTENPEKNQNG